MPFLATAPTKPLTPYQEQIREELNRTEAISVTAEQVERKSALDTLVVEGFALSHRYGKTYVYEPKQDRPKTQVPFGLNVTPEEYDLALRNRSTVPFSDRRVA